MATANTSITCQWPSNTGLLNLLRHIGSRIRRQPHRNKSNGQKTSTRNPNRRRGRNIRKSRDEWRTQGRHPPSRHKQPHTHPTILHLKDLRCVRVNNRIQSIERKVDHARECEILCGCSGRRECSRECGANYASEEH